METNEIKETSISMFDLFSINTIVNGDNIRFIANDSILTLLRLKIIKAEDLVSGLLKQSISGHLLSYVNIYRLSFSCNFEMTEENRVLLRESLIKNIIDYTEFCANFDVMDEYLDYCTIMVNNGKMNENEVMHFMNNYAHLSSYISDGELYEEVEIEDEFEDTINDINSQLNRATEETLEYLDTLYADYIREEDHNRLITN